MWYLEAIVVIVLALALVSIRYQRKMLELQVDKEIKRIADENGIEIDYSFSDTKGLTIRNTFIHQKSAKPKLSECSK